MVSVVSSGNRFYDNGLGTFVFGGLSLTVPGRMATPSTSKRTAISSLATLVKPNSIMAVSSLWAPRTILLLEAAEGTLR